MEDWARRLVERGVPSEWADRLAIRLVELEPPLGDGADEALLLGASAAVAVQHELRGEVERSLRDVREVERLLGAFSGELQKLDEVLEVLSAYAQRMRGQPLRTDRRILH